MREPVPDASSGGPIIITARGRARADATLAGVYDEFVLLFMIFGTLPGLVMQSGARVRWHLLGMGNEQDLHTAHWHGKTLRFRGWNTDVIELLPASLATADMLADNPGTWLLHCHVADHMRAAMFSTSTIRP